MSTDGLRRENGCLSGSTGAPPSEMSRSQRPDQRMLLTASRGSLAPFVYSLKWLLLFRNWPQATFTFDVWGGSQVLYDRGLETSRAFLAGLSFDRIGLGG